MNLFVLYRELVVVCYFFSHRYRLLGVDDDLLLLIDGDDFRITVWLMGRKDGSSHSSEQVIAVRVTYITAVVDEPGQVAPLGGIYDVVLVNPEQVR